MEISSLDGIRWTIDDALKYVTRQVRRGASFDGIILDPPAYGRGPDGERWKLDEYLNDILKGCAQILAPMNSFLVLNLYSNGYSAMLADTLVACAFGSAGRRTSGEPSWPALSARPAAALPESSSSAMTSAASCPSASASAWSGSRCWSVGLFVRYCLYG